MSSSKVMKCIISLLIIFFSMGLYAQTESEDSLPYYHIQDYEEDYTSGKIFSRMIDGLGFRYYWVTKDLSEKDLDYRPSEDGRNTMETLQHIHALSERIRVVAQDKVFQRPAESPELSYDQLREKTLTNLNMAAREFESKSSKELKTMKIRYQSGEEEVSFSLWNLINGPIADAIYHTGQVVAFRRAAGNPIQEGVNVFLGRGPE